MAAADTAKLVASLTLDAKGFQSGVAKANKSLAGLESTVGNIGSKAKSGLSSLSRNVGLIGVAAAGGIAIAVKGGLDNLAQLETAITSVDGAISQLGLTGQVSGAEIAKWANDIEKDIGAAFDDKEITAAAATLLRFGKVVPANLQQSLVVMTDLAAKTGDVESAANLLAKALADPGKAAGKLAKAGVVLTKAQQKTLKAMVETNDIAGAQKFILDELAKTTGGAAAASQGKYARSIAVLNDVVEDAQKALAIGFLPLIEKVADKLSTKLADPAFVKGLEEFGKTLAGGLDDLISVAEKLPWETIGTSLQIAGAGAKTLLEAFTALPPWIQTAVITGWGLNKLTGGALGGIVGELGKGLIKGVLGIQAAQVNITAANVTTAGGVPGATGAAPAAGGKLGGLLNAATKVFIVGAAVGVFAEAFAGSGIFDPTHRDTTGKIARTTNDPDQRLADLLASQKILLERANGGDTFAARQLASINRQIDELKSDTNTGSKDIKHAQQQAAAQLLASNERGEARQAQNAAALKAAVTTTGAGTATAIAGAKAATTAGLANVTTAANATKAAVIAKDLSVSIQNTFKAFLSVRETSATQTTFKQYNKFIS